MSLLVASLLLVTQPAQVASPPPQVLMPPPPVVAVPSGASIPQTPEHLALADALVEVAQISQSQMKMVPQVVEMLMPMMVRGNEAHAEEVRTILREEFVSIFTLHQKDFARASRDAFARHLSDQELRDLTAFYRTPTGQHLIEVQPIIMAESMNAGQDIGRRAAIDAMPRIIERMLKANLKVPERT